MWRNFLSLLLGLGGLVLLIATAFIDPRVRLIDAPALIVTRAELARAAASPSQEANAATPVRPSDNSKVESTATNADPEGDTPPPAPAASTLPEVSVAAVAVHDLPARPHGDVISRASPPSHQTVRRWRTIPTYVIRSNRGTWLSPPNPNAGGNG
jgi:hypothetical protein